MEDKNLNPVRKSEREGIRPGFLGGSEDKGTGKKINEVDKPVKAGVLGDNKNAAKNQQAVDKLNKAEAAAGGAKSGLFTGKGKAVGAGGLSSKKAKSKLKKALPLVAVGSMLLVGGVILLLASPMLIIGALDANLRDALGFGPTEALLEKQGESVVAEMGTNGEIANGFAEDLAREGVLVGQVTQTGDFVRTNHYVANIDDEMTVAASGLDYVRFGAEGELAFLFEGEVIKAGDFVAAVENNPRLYMAYSKALDITARFYYSDDVKAVFKELGLSRGSFNDWEATGNDKEDQASFEQRLTEILQSDTTATMGGCKEFEKDRKCDETDFSTGSAASEVISGASDVSNDTSKAAQLLNSAISASEPRQAAKAFLALEEPIQRARIGDGGPVNQVMNTLTRETEVTYIDVNTHEEVTTKKSILETGNFVAAVSGGGYSKSEANNFSRDGVLVATGAVNDGDITGTTVDDDGKAVTTAIEKGDSGVDANVINQANSSVAMATAEFDTDMYASVVGGNRIIEGGSYLSNTINLRTLGAMPSDATTIVAYQKEVDMALARKAEAERATLSPFDISSPNTFLGSLVHEFATSLVRRMSEGVSGANMTAVVGAAIDLTGDSVNGLFGSAIAEGSEEKFLTLAGDCATVKQAANTEGDLYCNSHNTISTKYMNYTASQWATELAGDLDNGHVIEDSGLEEYAIYGSDREVTVGVKSAAVCEAWKDNNPDLIGDIADVLAGVAGIYGSCQHGIDEERNRTLSEIATGSKYTLSASNADNATMEKYSGYVLYATVASLINESQSSVSRAKEEYYKKHPKDESAAGKIARMSGMTKAEAEVALNYASYLSLVANYNPSERFAFVGFSFGEPSELSFVHDEQVKENLYCYWRGRTEYEDVRNRSFAA